MFYTILSNRSIISVDGEDGIEFLQGLITNDARLLAEGKPVYAALLSPQGRFQHDFFLIPWQGRIFIDVLASRVADLLAKLKIYRLRSKVEIKLEESLAVAALWGGKLESSEAAAYKIYQDPRLPELGLRAIGVPEKGSFVVVPQEKYEYFRISLGVPDTRDMIVDKSLLLECGFEQLHGVDFGKGCYIGQEVTARSKFRGQVRKSLYMVKAEVDLPEIATPVTAGDKTVGEIRTTHGNIGIALLYNDEYEVAIAGNKAFLCGGLKIDISLAEWIKKCG